MGILQAEVRPSWQRDEVGAQLREQAARHRSGECRWAGVRLEGWPRLWASKQEEAGVGKPTG